MTKNKTETENEPVNEPVTESIVEPELSTKEKIEKLLADKKAAADVAVAAAAAQAEEAAALESIEIDSDVENMVDNIKALDVESVAMKAKMVAEIEPLNVQIAEIKAKPEYNLEDSNKTRKEHYDALVEKLGETAAKLLTGGAKATGTSTGKGKGRNSDGTSKKEVAVRAVCDEGLTLAEAVDRYPELGSVDGVRKNLWKPLKDGDVVKNSDGTYSRA